MAKILFKQRFAFPFEVRIETTDRLLRMQGQKVLKKRLDFRLEKRIETMDSIPEIEGQKKY